MSDPEAVSQVGVSPAPASWQVPNPPAFIALPTPLRPTPDATALLPAGHLLAALLLALPLPPLLWWGGAPLEALLVGGLGRLAMLVGLWYALRGP